MQKTAFSTNRPLGTGPISSCKQETKKSKSSFKNQHQSDNGMRVKANLATGSSAVKLSKGTSRLNVHKLDVSD